MEFRIQEVLGWIIPGLYLLGICLGFYLFNNQGFMTLYKSSIWHEIIQSDLMTALVVFAIPVIGMIAGYMLNYIGSFLEHLVYRIPFLPRPARLLLDNRSSRSKIADLDLLRKTLGLCSLDRRKSCNTLDNRYANVCRNNAVQHIAPESVERYYFRMIFGRNLATSQLISFIYILINRFIISPLVVIMAIVSVLLICCYYRDSLTYTKYCFVEYLRTIANKGID